MTTEAKGADRPIDERGNGMNVMRAHAAMVARHNRGQCQPLFPHDIDIETAGDFDPVPALGVGLAVISGALPDCRTDDDVAALAMEGAMLITTGTVSADEWSDAASDVIREVMAWGDKVTAAAGSN